MENLSIPPAESSFISIDDFQSRTPESFHGPTILYYKASQCKLVATEHDISSTRELNALRLADTGVNGSSAENADEENEKEVVVEGLDLWVTSEYISQHPTLLTSPQSVDGQANIINSRSKFFLYSTATSTGLSIPYRSISLHAIQRLKLPAQTAEVQGLYMHITNAATASSFPQESDEEESLTVTIVPPTATPSEGEESEIQKLYDAVSACANLHPDPVEEEEHDAGVFASGLVFPGSGEDGGLPPPVDGSSGWITAENMHEFFDEEGNWIGEGDGPSFPGMGSGLGPGAGTVRGRSEEAEEQGADGRAGADGDETKWRRID